MNTYPTRPGRLDFTSGCFSEHPVLNPMRQGDTFKRTITVELIDLTGHEMRCSVRAAAADEDAVLFMSTGNGRIAVFPNYFQFIVDPQTTEELPAGRYSYDLELITPGGNVYTLLEGRWDVVREFTKEFDA